MSRRCGLGSGIQGRGEVFVGQKLRHGLLMAEHGRTAHLLPFLERGRERVYMMR